MQIEAKVFFAIEKSGFQNFNEVYQFVASCNKMQYHEWSGFKEKWIEARLCEKFPNQR